MTPAAKRAKPILRVRQVRSGIGCNQRQNATLKALGLAKLGRVRVHPDTPQIRGMIGKISHLVIIEDDKVAGK